MPTNTATPSTMPAVVRIVRSTWRRKYGQEISRSRITSGSCLNAPHVLDDAAVAERDRALAAVRHVHVVRDDDDGGAESRVEIANQREDLFAGVRVEVARRFVGEEDWRI